MEYLVFLLGGAFGVSIANLSLLVNAVRRNGVTDEFIIDIAYECASIAFVFALFNVYMQL